MDYMAGAAPGKVRMKRPLLRQEPYSNNLLHLLFNRENNNYDRFKTWTNAKMLQTSKYPELEMFKCFPPNFTIQNIDKKSGFMRKFTPDGQVMLSFSNDQRSLEIYEYRSIGAMADLLDGMTSECITAADHSQQALRIRQEAFDRLFVLRSSILMKYGMPGGFLNREFSVFISPENSRFVLVASMGMTNVMPDVRDPYNYPDLYSDCDHFFYNFYLIDLMADYITDHVTYRYDSIQLSHNHAVSSVSNRVAIFSKYRQCIDFYEVYDGSLNHLYTLGVWAAHMREPCELLTSTKDFRPQAPRPLTHFKQRLITFLYRRALDETDPEVRKEKLNDFYTNFSRYERMVIVKMQMITTDLILLRYEQHPQDQSGSAAVGDFPPTLYVFYQIKPEKIVRVFEGSSVELLHVLRNYIDEFRNVISFQTGRRPPSSGNNIFLQSAFDEAVAMFDHPCQRMNPTLPISTQSYTTSPYLDYVRYMYDDHQISTLERPRVKSKVNSMETIVFRDQVFRDRVAFRMMLEPDDGGQLVFDPTGERFTFKTRRELVAYIFHPYEPFIISVQKMAHRYVVNFHLYNKSTIVSQG